MKVLAKSLLIVMVLLVSIPPCVFAQAGGDQKEAPKGLVNINTAGQPELEKLPGIGPSLAKRIVDFRQKNGSFKNVSDLVAVPGIGDKKFEQLKSLITVK